MFQESRQVVDFTVTQMEDRAEPFRSPQDSPSTAHPDHSRIQLLADALYRVVREDRRLAGRETVDDAHHRLLDELEARGASLVESGRHGNGFSSLGGHEPPEPIDVDVPQVNGHNDRARAALTVGEAIRSVSGDGVVEFDWATARALLEKVRERGYELA